MTSLTRPRIELLHESEPRTSESGQPRACNEGGKHAIAAFDDQNEAAQILGVGIWTRAAVWLMRGRPLTYVRGSDFFSLVGFLALVSMTSCY